ncbi:MAG: carbohydrate-binding protein [Anaerolineales bacterium]|nr:carbohydrate-binding protein [Anaerolineales bacterium]
MKKHTNAITKQALTIALGLILLTIILTLTPGQNETIITSASEPDVTAAQPQPASINTAVTILVDDFEPQPYEGDSIYYYNRIGGDRGVVGGSNVTWGDGQVTTTITPGSAWGGVWMSLNHPIREEQPINFSAILPPQILPAYQSQITSLTIQIVSGTPGSAFKVELKNSDDLQWSDTTTLTGGLQTLTYDLPPLDDITQLVWILDQASAGDHVVIDEVSFTATNPINDTAVAAFVWSYGMLLNTWNPDTGLVRDKAKDASGEFDAIQSTGSLAAAAAMAEQLGFINRADAVEIVTKIGITLLTDIPRYHGLWPHWVKSTPTGELEIVEDTEWSSVDSAIAALALLNAQTALGLDSSETEQMIQAIDWDDLLTPNGISHGYTYTGELIPYSWDTFGGESWLLALVYAAATHQVPPIEFSAPPTANGSGFIDELAWLFVPPPTKPDVWGTDWNVYRTEAAETQIAYYCENLPDSCFCQLDLFGLSAGEVPVPSAVAKNEIYQAFGVGGQFSAPHDGSSLLAGPIVAPHYAAMIASLRPQEAVAMWAWLINQSHFSPLNNMETLMFPAGSSCNANEVEWNQLKGSWNLALQTLGWGRYLAEQRGEMPVLWQAACYNPFLHAGYSLLAPNKVCHAYLPLVVKDIPFPFPTPTPTSTAAATVIPTINPSVTNTPTPTSTAIPWEYEREFEYPDEATVGQLIFRSNASSLKVHGQFGTIDEPPWSAKAGHVKYTNINIPQAGQLYLEFSYSKDSRPSSTPILISLDNETAPRATFYPIDQGNWNPSPFPWTDPINLGYIEAGTHSIKFDTVGQQYGVADLDVFILTLEPEIEITPTSTNTFTPTPVPPTNTFTPTPIPPTNTFTPTPIPPTNTFTPTPVPPTNTSTPTPIPPTNTFTPTTVPPTNTSTPTSDPTPWVYQRECEYPDEYTVGRTIFRSNASGDKVHGQFGTIDSPPWPAKSGYVKYTNIDIPQTDHLYFKLRYSKDSPSTVPISIYLDDESTARATFIPSDQGNWNQFAWTDPIYLGSVASGLHSIKLDTNGQQYGVADLDVCSLMVEEN